MALAADTIIGVRTMGGKPVIPATVIPKNTLDNPMVLRIAQLSSKYEGSEDVDLRALDVSIMSMLAKVNRTPYAEDMSQYVRIYDSTTARLLWVSILWYQFTGLMPQVLQVPGLDRKTAEQDRVWLVGQELTLC